LKFSFLYLPLKIGVYVCAIANFWDFYLFCSFGALAKKRTCIPFTRSTARSPAFEGREEGAAQDEP
jgi:hypothetical protein